MKLKHSKFKNTGILFELLIRQVTADTLSTDKESKALGIIKKYFGNQSILFKELDLYQTLIKEHITKEERANSLINACLKSHKVLNKSKLQKQKWSLIKEIKENYNLDNFFQAKIENYKPLAAIYKLFEFSVADSPIESVNNRYTLIEHLSRTTSTIPEDSEIDAFIKQDKDVQSLTTKIIIDKFNETYKDLSLGQRNILKEFINSASDNVKLKSFVIDEASKLKSIISKYTNNVDDLVVKIKLHEVVNLLDTLSNKKQIKESHLISLLQYHELLKELKLIQK